MLQPSTQFALDTAHHAQNAIKLIRAAIRVIQIHPDTGLDLLGQAADINTYLAQTALRQSKVATELNMKASEPKVIDHPQLDKNADDVEDDDLRRIMDCMRDMSRETGLPIDVYD